MATCDLPPTTAWQTDLEPSSPTGDAGRPDAPPEPRARIKKKRLRQEASGEDENGKRVEASREDRPHVKTEEEEQPPRRLRCPDSKGHAPHVAVCAPDATSYCRELSRVMVRMAQAERVEARERLRGEALKLGRCRRGLVGCASDREVQWDGGTDAEHMAVMRSRVTEQKQQVEKLKKSLVRPQKGRQSEGKLSPSRQEELEEEAWEQRELKIAKEYAVNREELELRDRDQRLHVERMEHVRRLRALEAEDRASLQGFPTLHKKYQLLRLSSRNGTTEVYHAYDLLRLQPCVVKIHSLDVDLNAPDRPERLEAIAQECESFRWLSHTALSKLLDHFPLESSSSYVTVWETMESDTLAAYLLRNGPITEKEARGILLQILSALRFAQVKGHQMDCEDLKPSRLLFRGGEVRITSLLLPHVRSAPARASGCAQLSSLAGNASLEAQEEHPMDDVSSPELWTVGLALYEMLFGKRPDVEKGEPGIHIPEQPRLSNECRVCLGRLLDHDARLSVQEAYNDPFVSPTRRQR